ncbi:MAG: chemotaxis protein CheA, partial [Thermomicrobiaceae bacterium]|nr:chemotaxis protein CheA [Thermomicrobiaceae bacterium]
LEETRERIEAIEPALVDLERAGSAAERERILHDVFRHLHSTKGSAGYLGLTDLVALLHAAEQLADVLRKGAPLRAEHVDLLLRSVTQLQAYLVALASQEAAPGGLDALAAALNDAAAAATASPGPEAAAEAEAAPSAVPEPAAGEPADARASAPDAELFASTVRVPVAVLDRLGRLAEEMLVTRNRITSLATAFQDLELTGASKKLSVMVSELQDIAASTRLQPISHLFSQMPRVVRDAARATGKEVDLAVEGGSLEVDRRILQELRDPLVHLLRNAVDHGLESPQRRVAAGKPSRGQIRLAARREGSNLVIEVSDDGAGIDYEVVRAKAIDRGFISAREAAAMSEADLVNLLLRPGFSTRDSATELSGRGVGLDVVAVRMQELGGSLGIQSALGKGTTVHLTVPTSVSVVNTLVFTARGYLLGLPYNYVQEIVLIDERQVERYGAQEVFRLRDQLVPLFTLESWPDRRGGAGQSGKRYVLVLRDHRAVAGLWCDGIARFEELIVKPVGNVIRGVDVITGLASLGTGEIVLILEPEALLAEANLRATELAELVERGELAAQPADAAEADDFAERMILVRGYGDHRYALPVRLVERIIRFSEADLSPVGERVYLRQGSDLIPLLDLDASLGLGPGGREGIALLLVSEGQQCALAAAEVLRIGPVSARPQPSEHRAVVGLLSLPDGVYLPVSYTHVRAPATSAAGG